jgi:hypothetical protein
MAAATLPRPRQQASFLGSTPARTVVVLAALAAGAPGRARANGAFPDSFGILLPPDRPAEIDLATNFGVISSEDSGKTWTWTCEQVISNQGFEYQLGAPPSDRLFALSTSGLIFSDDRTCGWTQASPTPDTARITDFFPDPTDAKHVLAIILPNSPMLAAEGVYASTDGGATFGNALFEAPTVGGLTGIEIARSDPHIAYAAMFETPGIHPRLVKSTDGGATWGTPVDIEKDIGPNLFSIIAIDPTNPQKIYVRVSEALQESLAVSDDGGMSFKKPVMFPIKMGAFARLKSGTILVAGFKSDDQGLMIPIGYRSTDGGMTFTAWDQLPSLRALAERDGKLYAAADNFMDPFALGVSTDEGVTWLPLMKFSQVFSIKSCLQTTCATSCATQARLELWSSTTCVAPGARKSGGCQAAPPSTPVAGGRRALPSMLLLALEAGALAVGVRARRRRAHRDEAALDRMFIQSR